MTIKNIQVDQKVEVYQFKLLYFMLQLSSNEGETTSLLLKNLTRTKCLSKNYSINYIHSIGYLILIEPMVVYFTKLKCLKKVDQSQTIFKTFQLYPCYNQMLALHAHST